jgi:hypothetical protein
MVNLVYQQGGRLGNSIIQYFAAYIFAKKFNLKLNATTKGWDNFDFNSLIKNTIIDGNIGYNTIELTDENFIEYLERDSLELNKYNFNGYFQIKDFLQNYENDIKSNLNLIYKDVDKDLVFVHYRIGDVINKSVMLPLEYYIEALEKINCKGGYISSDSINHEFCKILMDKFNLLPINLSPLDTIMFAKDFNNIVLSEGTFSWCIGFFSRTSNIIYNKRNINWHGDIFFDRWTSLSWDYDSSTVNSDYTLTSYKPIKL